MHSLAHALVVLLCFAFCRGRGTRVTDLFLHSPGMLQGTTQGVGGASVKRSQVKHPS